MLNVHVFFCSVKGKGSPYSITERCVPELIPVLGSQPTGDVSHKPDGRLPLLSARPAITLATIKRAATSFGAWWTEARWVWTVCLRLLPDSVAAAIWTQAFVHLSQHANHSATEPPSVVIVICRSFQPVNYNIVGRVRSLQVTVMQLACWPLVYDVTLSGLSHIFTCQRRPVPLV